MSLTLKSKVKDVCAHPIGRDVVDKLLLQLNKPNWLADNAIVGNLSLGFLQRLVGKNVDPGFFDAILTLLNSEPDVPKAAPNSSHPPKYSVADAQRSYSVTDAQRSSWWKEAVFYQIYPRSFCTEGVCALQGILSKLDYLKSLGIDAVWLSPVYDSPNDDNGYDISDYRKILPEFGTMADMDALIDGLHSRGMKLVMDLVVNHTSDEHAWFQEALRDKSSPRRNYYFFHEGESGKPNDPPNNWTSFFSGSAWNFYKEQNEWALHLFSKKQMDLNWECKELREEVYDMIRWWLAKGVDGFRMDVINYISKTEGLPNGNLFIGELMGYTGIEKYFYGPKLHDYLREMRAQAFEPYGAFTVGETPGVGTQMSRLLTDDYRKELDLIFSFDHLETPGHTRFEDYEYDARYLKTFYMRHLNADLGYGWQTLFFNNHDNPRMVSKIDPAGARTKLLATMLATLQLTLRGTPFLYQGDEIAATNISFKTIGEFRDVESVNLYNELLKTKSADEAFKIVLSGSRDHARAPMDWKECEKQQTDANSVFGFYQKLIALRKEFPALVYGELTFLYPKEEDVLCYTRILSGAPDKGFYIEANLTAKVWKSKAPAGAELLAHNNYVKCGSRSAGILEAYEARVYQLQ